MEDTNKELERIQKALLEEEEDLSLEELLSDDELTALLQDHAGPAFEDPEEIHEPKGNAPIQNFANGYGAAQREAARKKQNDKTIIGLMLAVCALCMGIIGMLAYWLGVLL